MKSTIKNSLILPLPRILTRGGFACLFVLCFLVLSVFNFCFVSSVFADTYSLTDRVKQNQSGVSGLPSGKTYCDLTSEDTLDVTASAAQIWLATLGGTYNLNCNIDISGNSYNGELTGKIRMGSRDTNNASTININGIVNLTDDTTIGSAYLTDARGKLYFCNQITGEGGLTICPGTGNPVYLNNATSNFNNYKGGTQLGHPAMYKDGGTQPYAGIVYLNADEQIPDALTAGNSATGNLILNSYSNQISKLYLGTHTETVNGLVCEDTGTALSVITGESGSLLKVGANNATSTYAGLLQGAMQLEKIGTGTLTLSQAPSYTGATTVTSGTLALSVDSTLYNLSGTNAGVLNNNGKTITVESSADTEFAGVIEGAGGLTKTGAKTLTLSGANTYTGGTTISDSTLKLTDAGTLGTGAVSIANGATLEFAHDTDQTFTNALSGSGTVIKTGDGRLKIDAAQGFQASNLTVTAGRLDFKGTLTGGGITVEDAIFSPGNSIGTAEVGGTFTLSNGGAVIMEIGSSNPGENDVMIVTGDLALNNGVIYLELDEASGMNPGDRFTAVLHGNNSAALSENDFINRYIRTTDFMFLSYEQLTEGEYAGKYAITGAVFDANAVPEPATWLLLLLGAFGLLYWRKK